MAFGKPCHEEAEWVCKGCDCVVCGQCDPSPAEEVLCVDCFETDDDPWEAA